MIAQPEQSPDRAKRLFRSKVGLASVAVFSICSRIEIGSAKYDPDSWRDESAERHIRRAIKHALTHLEIRGGDRADDQEDHLAAAIYRLCMALSVRNTEATDGHE